MSNLEKLSKYSGVDFYQDYILPSNPSSKNKFYKKLFRYKAGMILDNKNNIYYLNKRKNDGKYFLGVHVTGAIIIGYLTSLSYINKNTDSKVIIELLILNILINIYPILVQLRTNYRINNVLKKYN